MKHSPSKKSWLEVGRLLSKVEGHGSIGFNWWVVSVYGHQGSEVVPKLNLRLGSFFVDKKTGRYVCVRIYIYTLYVWNMHRYDT